MKVPNSLFRYRTLNSENCAREMDAISECYVWLSRYDNLNDPMEFFIQNNFGKSDGFSLLKILGDAAGVSSADVEHSIYGALDIARNYSVCCFSDSPQNEPMWAYYAGSLSGICLEYDANLIRDRSFGEEHPLLPVEYSLTAPVISFANFLQAKDDLNLELVRALVGTKKVTWQHENEIRLIQSREGKFYHSQDALKSITVGPRTPDAVFEKLTELVRNRGIRINRMLTDGYKSTIKVEAEYQSGKIDRTSEFPDIEKLASEVSLPIGGVKAAINQAFCDPDFGDYVFADRAANSSDRLCVAYNPRFPTNSPTPQPYRCMYFTLGEWSATRCFKWQ